tara:strand:+ start:3989 stop:4246 length:258 start_codon:yes stop_codon:yes gene_type:complete
MNNEKDFLDFAGIFNGSGFDDSDKEGLGEELLNMVKEGIVEQYIGEDGQFYFSLTNRGGEIAKNLLDKLKDEDSEDSEDNEGESI